jgi:hypothetical protein
MVLSRRVVPVQRFSFVLNAFKTVTTVLQSDISDFSRLITYLTVLEMKI